MITDRQTDISDCRVAFATEKKYLLPFIENLIVIVLFFSATPSIAETNDTSAVNSTAPANETAPADNATTRPEPDSVSIDFIELDPNQGCYIPGASEVNNKFQDSQDQYKTFVSVVGAKRREAQQNFTTSTIPEEVPEVERSILPNAEIITKMFPDIGDGFVVETWLASLSKITMKAMRDIKNSTATKGSFQKWSAKNIWNSPYIRGGGVLAGSFSICFLQFTKMLLKPF